MKARPHWITSLPLVAVLVLTTCSRPPNETIQRVSSAFDGLEAMKAKDYVTQSYQQAEQAYAEAMAEIEMQRQRSPWSRSYSRAGDLLSTAQKAMEQTTDQAEDRRDEVAREAADLIEEAKAMLESAESGLAKMEAPGPKKRDIRAKLENATETLREARNAFDSGDFLGARSKADDANVSLVDVQAVIDGMSGR